jgi:type VI secretion system protein ImpJ
LLFQLLERAIPQNCVAIPLRQVDATTSAASLDEDRLLRPVAAYLAVRSPRSPADIASEVPKKLKVSSSDLISGLVRQALPGARLTHAPSPPSAVPIRLDAQYFEITRSGADWDGIVSARNIAAYAPSDLAGASMEVIFLLPERT